jgi:hypothetical protein
MTNSANPLIFFVLRGLINGEKGCRALTLAGRQLADGWYYHPFEDSNCEPEGLFNDREEATDAFKSELGDR